MYPILTKSRCIRFDPEIPKIYINIEGESIVQPINESAAAILSLCNGSNTADDIVDVLVRKYQDSTSNVKPLVVEFLEHSRSMGMITFSNEQHDTSIKLIGSEESYIPHIAFIEVTHSCPLRCKHCYVSPGTNTQIDIEKLIAICEETVNLSFEIVQLTGGEPLLYRGIERAIQTLVRGEVSVFISTSGYKVDPIVYDALKLLANGKGWVQVSLDGFEESHNRMRGCSVFTNAITLIKNLVRDGVNVAVATCATEPMLGELEELCKMVKSLGVKRHRIGFVSERGRALENGLTSPIQFREKVTSIRTKLKKKFNESDFIIEGLDDVTLDSFETKQQNCGAGYRQLRISPDLNVHPCLFWDMPIANLSDLSLLEYGKQYGELLAQLHSPSKQQCGSCVNLPLCDSCIAEALYYKEKVDECSWFKKQSHFLQSIVAGGCR